MVNLENVISSVLTCTEEMGDWELRYVGVLLSTKSIDFWEKL